MVWTTNNGIHFFRRPSQLHPSLFLSSWYSSSLARSKRSKGAWAQCCIQNTSFIIFQILFFMAVLVPLGKHANDMNISMISQYRKFKLNDKNGMIFNKSNIFFLR